MYPKIKFRIQAFQQGINMPYQAMPSGLNYMINDL